MGTFALARPLAARGALLVPGSPACALGWLFAHPGSTCYWTPFAGYYAPGALVVAVAPGALPGGLGPATGAGRSP
jgi:hypothetical protein